MRIALASLVLAGTASNAHAGFFDGIISLTESCPPTPPVVSSDEPCLKTEWITSAKQCFAGVSISSTSSGVSIDHDGLALTLDTSPGTVKTRRTTSGMCIYVSNSNGASFTLTRFTGDAPKLQVASGGENRVVIAVNASGLGVWNQPLNRGAEKLLAIANDTFMDYTDDAVAGMKWQPQNNIFTLTVEGFARSLAIDVPKSTLFDPNRWTQQLGGNCWEFAPDLGGNDWDFAPITGELQNMCRQNVATWPFTTQPTLVMSGTNGTIRLFNATITRVVQ